MTRIGQGVRTLLPSAIFGALGVAIGCLFMWGYTVDDAWISLRYARHLASGVGYRFNTLGPSTDGVTPLPWAFMLAPLARFTPATSLLLAKVLGVMATLAAALRVSAFVARRIEAPRDVRYVLAILPGLSLPVAAYAVSGMETPVAVLLVAFAVTSIDRPVRVALYAGLACLFRPELIVWASALAFGAVRVSSPSRVGVYARAVGVAVAPFFGAMVLRYACFGDWVPLAVAAKPSDPMHGAVYAAGALLVLGVTPLVVAPLSFPFRSTRRVLVASIAAHMLSLVVLGGDWMAFSRLAAPMAVPMVVLGAELVETDPRRARIRTWVAFANTLLVLFLLGKSGRGVTHDRADLIARAAPVLASSRVIGALDIGWVSATTDATIFDFAGVTDPEIAFLGGGHTSKRIDATMLLSRNVDTVLLYGNEAPDGGPLRRTAETRIWRSPLFQSHFREDEFLALGTSGAGYRVFRRVE